MYLSCNSLIESPWAGTLAMCTTLPVATSISHSVASSPLT
jgi:hypothetical protein